MIQKPAPEERVWSVIAHLSALAMGIGLFLPVFGWAVNRRKSNYISFQCLQALGYQTLGYTVWILVVLLIVVFQSFALLSQMVAAAESNADFETLVAIGMGGNFLLMGLIGVYVLLPFVAAVACALGYEFRYPLLGKRLAQYLNYARMDQDKDEQWMIEEHEDRWVASMGHFAIIIVLWGLAAPITAWAMQGKRSLFLKFQSAQTIVFQVLSLFMLIGAGFFYFFGVLVFFLAIGFEGEVALDSTGIMVAAVVFFVSLLTALFLLMVIPFMHILGQWAGYRLLKGEDYRYPLVGKMVLKRLSKTTPPQTTA